MQNLAGGRDVEENTKSPETKASHNCLQFPLLKMNRSYLKQF